MLTGYWGKGQTGCPPGGGERGGVRREARLLRWAGGGVSDGASGWGNLYLKLLPHYGPGWPWDTFLGGGPGSPRPPVPAPAPHSRNPQGLALLPAGSAAAFRARPHTPAAHCRWPAEQQPCCPEPRHDPEPHPAHRKSPTGKQPLAGDVVRKPQSRERAGKPSREAGPDGTLCARAPLPRPQARPGSEISWQTGKTWRLLGLRCLEIHVSLLRRISSSFPTSTEKSPQFFQK